MPGHRCQLRTAAIQLLHALAFVMALEAAAQLE